MGSKYKMKSVETDTVETDTKKGSEHSVAEEVKTVAEEVEEKIAPDTTSGEAVSKDGQHPKTPDGEKLHETSKKSAEDGNVGDAVLLDGQALDTLPISIDFVVGQIQTTVGELKQTTSGSILTLDRKPQRYVDLYVNGKKIGCGELVQMNEQLGVRILDVKE